MTSLRPRRAALGQASGDRWAEREARVGGEASAIRRCRRRIATVQASALEGGKIQHRYRAHAGVGVQKTMQAGEVVRRFTIRRRLQRHRTIVTTDVVMVMIGVQRRCMFERMKLTQRGENRLDQQAASHPCHQQQAQKRDVAACEGHWQGGYKLAQWIANRSLFQ